MISKILLGIGLCVSVYIVGTLMLGFITWSWWFDVAALDTLERIILTLIALAGVIIGILTATER